MVNGKFFAEIKDDLGRVRDVLESSFEQVYSSAPTRADKGDFFVKFKIILDGWENEPATVKQLLCLLSVGIHFDDEITKGEASKIIKDQLQRRAQA